MIKKETIELIKKAIEIETRNAIETYGEKYNSYHEGYAILKEEIEEVMFPAKTICDDLERMWSDIRADMMSFIPDLTDAMLNNLINLIAEACQCCAVINKIKKGVSK